MTRRVRQLRAMSAWSDEHVRVLLNGHDWFYAFSSLEQPMAVPTRSREGWDEQPHVEQRLRDAVADLGDELLDEWIAKEPGSRPWYWWRFMAPEPRRCLTGPHRYTRPEYADVPHRLFFGVPCLGLAPHFGRGEEYESEAAYLERLDLLLPRERELLTTESLTTT